MVSVLAWIGILFTFGFKQTRHVDRLLDVGTYRIAFPLNIQVLVVSRTYKRTTRDRLIISASGRGGPVHTILPFQGSPGNENISTCKSQLPVAA